MANEQVMEPSVDPLADERIQFYLRHRATIREWAAIERDLAAATHQLLVGLIPLVEAAVRELDPNAEVHGQGLDGGYPRLVAMRATWPKSVSGEPLAALTLEWTPKVDPSGGSLPYYGVRVNAEDDRGKAVGEALRLLVGGSDAAQLGFKAASYVWWPVQQRLPASADWWKDTDAFRLDVVNRTATAWQALAPLIESALAT